MRPKKKVLVFCENPDELGRIGFVLWTKHLHPVLASTGGQTLIAAQENELDCAMVMAGTGLATGRVFAGTRTRVDAPSAVASFRRAEDVVLELARARPGLPIVCFAPANVAMSHTLPALVMEGADVAAMVERVRVLAARKRGPAKKTPPRGYLTSNLQRVG